MTDEYYIKRAIRLAAKAQGMTSPNPMVGAIIVKNGDIISEDFHRRPGTPHAEVLAIEKAGYNANGSKLFVSLEPCCHTEKRTPPCTKIIINAGIKEVVIGMRDPNPKVSGRGILELQKEGISVKSGVLEEDAKRLNESYIKYITTQKPFVTLKIAMTLDGKIATPEGQSKWITGEKARRMVHRQRSHVDAIMTAIGTVKADDPQLTKRVTGGRNPQRIVIDPYLEIPLNAKILKIPPETIIVTKVDNSKASYLEKSGAKIIYFKEKIDLNLLMEKLGKMEITSVIIEGGSSLNAHVLEDGIVDKIMFFISPKIIGGKDSFPSVGGKSYRKLEEAYKISALKIKRIGEDILVEGYIK
ncbi:MAG: riboflavin biosynthesis protein RibD [Nitrospirae bacterium RBG_13_39_12]|nr:MAG: riboflavin biosynthesis protein RibD [Nitrospirae bacterium RBG_13_39_12]